MGFAVDYKMIKLFRTFAVLADVSCVQSNLGLWFYYVCRVVLTLLKNIDFGQKIKMTIRWWPRSTKYRKRLLFLQSGGYSNILKCIAWICVHCMHRLLSGILVQNITLPCIVNSTNCRCEMDYLLKRNASSKRTESLLDWPTPPSKELLWILDRFLLKIFWNLWDLLLW